MGFRDMLRGALLGAASGLGGDVKAKSAPGEWLDFMFRTGADTLPTVARLRQPYLQSVTFYRALRAFSQNVARIPLEFRKKGTDTIDTTHPVNVLWSRPNGLLRGRQLQEVISLDLEHWGNCFLWLGEPVSLRPGDKPMPGSLRRIRPTKVRDVRFNEVDEPESYAVQTATRERQVPAEEIVHFRYWNPYDDKFGTSWAQAALDEMESDYYMLRHNKAFFKRGARVDGVLKPTGTYNLTPEQAEDLKMSIVARHVGQERSWTPMILPAGLEWENVGSSARDMDFNAGRRYQREQTLSGAGLPPGLAGILEYANYANMLPQLRIFFELELFPRLEYVQSVIQADLLDRFGIPLDAAFKVDVVNALVEDLGAKVDAAAKLQKMGVTLGQVNERLELGFDLKGNPVAETPMLDFSITPAESVLNPPEPADPAADPTETEDEDDSEDAAEEGKSVRKGWSREKVRSAIWKNLRRFTRDLETKAESRWRDFARRLEREVLANLSRITKAAPGPGDVEAILFGPEDAAQEARVLMEPIMRASMGRGADSLKSTSGIAIAFNFLDPGVLEQLQARRVRIVGVTVRQRKELRAAISESIAAGHTEEEVRQRVLDFFAGERRNARTIARTEVHSAFSAGRFEGMKQAGVKEIEWLSSRDDRVRESHIDLDGDSVPIGETFANGCKFPTDPDCGDPSEVINCRCDGVPKGSIVPGEEP